MSDATENEAGPASGEGVEAPAARPQGGPAAAGAQATPKAAEAGKPGAEPTARAPRAPGAGSGMDMVLDVPLRVTVEIGSARMLVQEVLQLGTGSVIELDRMAGEPADLLVNGRVVARGEVVVSDERLSIRLVEILGGERLVGSRH